MKHILPSLPYDAAALEPYIDARTMTLHHDQHHASYVAKLNTALEQAPALQGRSALWLLLNPDAVPEPVRTAVRNNAGGHVNHSQLWRVMAPPSGKGKGPAPALAAAIDNAFGSLKAFQAKFDAAGAEVFGSGWVWLVLSHDSGGGLTIMTTPGHENPLMQGHYPLLANDVWEHAYYLKHENRRKAYLEGWWPVVNWDEVGRRFEHASRIAKLDFENEEALQAWEGEGGHLETSKEAGLATTSPH
jgi:Fe-Mn family superoxide dismutase